MKKLIALIAVLLILTALFAGCTPTGGSSDNSTSSPITGSDIASPDIAMPTAPSSGTDMPTATALTPPASATDIASPAPTRSAR